MKAAGSVGLKHRSSWERMALVTDKDWIKHAAAVVGPLALGTPSLRPKEKAQAKTWIAGPLSE
jgi:SpoIIAA-like